jgi:DNA-binding beta-propeller fold protein YncE
VLPDAAGNVYVADTHNCVIRKVANDANRTVTSVAGAYFACSWADGVGGAARLSYPMGMAWLDATHIVLADSSNQAIRVLDVTSRAVATLAIAHNGDDADGPAASASFYWPTAVAVAPDGRVFFVASSTGKVKVIGTDSARTVTTLVAGGLGFGDGPGTGARLQPQMGLLWFNNGLVLSDPGSHMLRWIFPGSTSGSTAVKSFAGNGRAATTDGSGASAAFEVPLGLWRGMDGNVYVVDGTAGTLRVVRP